MSNSATNKKRMAHGEKVLVIGRHPDLLTKIVTMLQQHGYRPFGTLTNEAAMAAFRNETFDAVIIGGGVDSESREFFYTEFLTIHPAVKNDKCSSTNGAERPTICL